MGCGKREVVSRLRAAAEDAGEADRVVGVDREEQVVVGVVAVAELLERERLREAEAAGVVGGGSFDGAVVDAPVAAVVEEDDLRAGDGLAGRVADRASGGGEGGGGGLVAAGVFCVRV